MAVDDIVADSELQVSTRAQKVFKWLRVYIVPALGLICTGAGLGIGCFIRLSSERVPMSDTVVLLFSLPGEILMRMLKVIILPLIVSSTFSASARLPASLLGKMSLKILLFYLTTSLLSAGVGVFSVFVFQPSTWDLLHAKTSEYVENDNYWLSIVLDFIRNLLPENLIQAFYQHTETTVITSEYVSYHYEISETTTILNYTDFADFENATVPYFDTDLLNSTDYDFVNLTNLSSVLSSDYSNELVEASTTSTFSAENSSDLFEAEYLVSSFNGTDYGDYELANATTDGELNFTTTTAPSTTSAKRKIVRDVVERSEWISVYKNGPSLLGLIVIHAIFGMASRHVNNQLVVLLENFCTALHLIMIKISRAIMWYFPIGVFFLTLSDVLSTGEIYPFSQEMALFAAAIASAMMIHGILTLSLLYWFLTRKNPFLFWKQNWAPFLIVFGTKSRITSLPYNMKCMEDKGAIDDRLSRLFLPLGSALNSDGDAIYGVVSTLFLVHMSGVELSLEHYLYVCLLSFVLSFTSSSLHTNGIVYMHQLLIVQMSIQQLAVLSSVDWIGGRLRETVNVISDAVAVSVTQHYNAQELKSSDHGKYNLDKLNNRFIPKTYSHESTDALEDSDSNGECERYTDV